MPPAKIPVCPHHWSQEEMAACPDVLVVGGILLLTMNSNPVWGNYTILGNDNNSNKTDGHNIAAIVAPTVTLGVLALVLAIVAWLLCVVKKKRQTEGTYRPSAEEQSGASCTAAPDALKLPKEERLI